MLKIVDGGARQAEIASGVFIAGALTILAGVTVHSGGNRVLTPILALTIVVVVLRKMLLPWRSLIALIVVVILFVPIKRYTLPGSLPFQLEPYRLLVGLVCLIWVTSLLIDPTVRVRRSDFDLPLLLYVAVVGLSLVVNPRRAAHLFGDVFKSLLFFASFIILYYVVVSVLRRRRDIELVATTLAAGGTILAMCAVIESRTHYNVFNHLSSVVPFLDFQGAEQMDRAGRLRVLGSAQHPIALGAAFVMLIPLAIYRAQATGRRRWWFSLLLLTLGALSTSSRTAITMLLALAIVYFVLRGRQVRRIWPVLLPAIVAIHFAIPGALGTAFYSFFPKGGLIAEQQNAEAGHARLSSLGPALHDEVALNPIVGVGFATRVTVPTPSVPVPNAPILDDQWLSILCETGIAGVFTLGWLFVRFIRRVGGAAKRDATERGWLLCGAAAAVAAYGVGMLTYDAFSFIQVTFLFFITLGLGAAAVQIPSDEWAADGRLVLAHRI